MTREERSRGAAREAGDVMAFGQEVGRVLSDGRIVGRAEPFAKVFSSSRAVKRAVGVTAWAVLEDIALDARIDDRGRLVAETNVRRIAENLGLNKETVSKHLGILREYGFVLQEEERDRASGQYRRYRYVIDPTAGIERFTHTPSRRSRDASEAGLAPRTEEPDAADRAPRLASPDPAPPVPAPPVPGDPGQQEQEDQSREQRHDATESLRRQLAEMGVAAAVAGELVASNQPERLRDAIRAAGTETVRKPAAWVVRALRDGWEFEGRLAGVRAEQTHQHRRDREIRDARAAEQLQREDRRRAAGWSAAISAALDDNALGRAIAAVTRPPTGLQRLPVPLAHAQLLAWAIEAHQRAPDQPLQAALRVALASDSVPTAAQLSDEWPEPPHASADHAGTTDLTTRIASRLSCPAQQRTTQARSI